MSAGADDVPVYRDTEGPKELAEKIVSIFCEQQSGLLARIDDLEAKLAAVTRERDELLATKPTAWPTE